MNSNEAKPISVCCQIAKIYSPKPIKSDNNKSGKGFFNFNFKTKVSKRNSFQKVNLNVNQKKLEKEKEKKNFLDSFSCEEIEKDFKSLKLDLFEDEIKVNEEIIAILNSTKSESNENSPQNNQKKISRPQNPFYKNFEEE